MIKTTLVLIATALLAANSALAGGACCAGKSADHKMECAKTYAALNLTPEQKTKLETAQEKCLKDGCTTESMDKFKRSAKGILSAEQYAQFETECAHMKSEEKKS